MGSRQGPSQRGKAPIGVAVPRAMRTQRGCQEGATKGDAPLEGQQILNSNTQFPRLIIQNFNLAYDFWVFEFNLAYDPWVFEFKSCAQFTIVRILHCDSHPTVQKPKFGP